MAAPIVLGITIRADGSAQVTGELNRVRDSVNGAGNAAQGANRQFAAYAESMASADRAAQAIAASTARTTAIYNDHVARLTQSNSAYRAYQLQLEGLHPSQIRHIQALEATRAASVSSTAALGGLNSMVGAFGLALGAVGLARLAKDILDTNRSMESLRAQLKSVTGSAEEAQLTFEFITRFAVNTPFEINGLTKAFLTLQNFGIKPTTQVMDAITNQAAKLGGSSENLQGIVLALGQAWGKGKLQGQEIMQLINQGVPVYDLLARVTGKNTTELADMSEKGLITRDVIDKLIIKMGEMAAGSNAAAMETLNGKISNLADAWHQFEDTLMGDKSEGLIKSIVGSITNELNILTQNMSTTLDGQIAHAQARIKTFNSMGSVGSFVADMTGYDVNIEKNRLDSLTRQKNTQDEVKALKDKSDELLKSKAMEESAAAAMDKASGSKKKALSEEEKALKAAATAAKNKADAIVKGIESEIQALNDHHMKLALSDRDYELYKLSALGMKDAVLASSIAIWDSNKAIDAQKASGDKAKSEMDTLIDKYNQLTMSARDYYATTLKSADGTPLTQEQSAPLLKQYDKNAAVEISSKSITDSNTALTEYNKSIDSANKKTSDLGAVTSAIFDGALGGIHAMAGAFDNMVNSIDQSTKALDENAKMQKLNEATVDQVAKASNSAKYAAEELRLNNQITQEKLSGARQIAGAVSSMLKQGSTEQRAAHAIEMGLAGVQMAMQLMKIVGIGAVTEAEIASVGPAVTAATTKSEANALEAITGQAAAGPYIGFALMAAMAIAMAALGFGKGAGSVSAGPQGMSPDTGTVLGDSTAKSQSIDKTYTLLKDIQAQNYPVLQSIDKGISDLHSGITDVITRLFQAGGLSAVTAPKSVAAKNLNLANTTGLDPIGNFLINGIMGGKQTSNVVAQGISTDATAIMDIIAGKNLKAQQFAQIETKTDGGWFGKDTFSFSNQYAALDTATQKALNDVFKSMGTTMLGLADNLGFGLSDRVKNYIIPALTVDLKGLSGADAATKLNGVISTALDTMSVSIFGDILGQYQQLGEGMLETAVRVVSEVAVVKDALAGSGLSLSTNAIAISDAMIKAAGSIKEFQASFQTYYDKFYTDTEKTARAQQQLNNTLLAGLVVLPQTREGYRKLIEGLDMTNALDQQRYSILLSLSAVADTYYQAMEAQMTTAKDNLATAYKTESDALTVTINKFDTFSKSLMTFRDSLITGNAELSLADKYNATRAAFNANNAAISAGPGTTTESKAAFDAAMGSLQSTSQSFLSASKDYSVNALSYAADYGQVMASLQSGISAADLAKSDATLQLDQLKASVSGLITINASVLSVRDAILAIQFIQTTQNNATAAATYAVAKASVPQFATGGEHLGGWRVVGETGAELEHTGPSRIFSHSQSKSLINNDDVIAAIEQLKAEARSNAIAIAKAAADTAKILARWDGNGMPSVRVES